MNQIGKGPEFKFPIVLLIHLVFILFERASHSRRGCSDKLVQWAVGAPSAKMATRFRSGRGESLIKTNFKEARQRALLAPMNLVV